MRLPAGLKAIGVTVSLDRFSTIEQARARILTRTDAGEGGRVAH
jgi:hypothetical protein